MNQLEYLPGIGGQSVQLDGPTSFVGIAENLRSREWEYDLGYRDLVSATRPAREVDVTFQADYATADDLRRVADADVTARTPGIFIAQKEWRQRGYILASQPNDIHYGRLSTELKIALLDGAWWRLVSQSFTIDSQVQPEYANLLRGTDNLSSDNLALTRAAVADNVITLTPTTAASYAKAKVDYLDYSSYAGKTLTFSVDARLAETTSSYTSSNLRLYIGVNASDRIDSTLSSTYDRYSYIEFSEVSQEWARYSFTAEIPDDLTTGTTDALVAGNYVTAQVAVSGSKKPVEVRNIKLEVGAEPTPYEVTYLDYPHDYSYDYQKTSYTGDITPSVLTPSDVHLVIYGPAVNPYVIVGGNRYQVNVTVPSGGYVVVDGRDKTIMLTLADGTVQNVFSSGVRGGGSGGGTYVFEKVPAGTSEVTYDGSFGFDLGWYEEEGEPPWNQS